MTLSQRYQARVDAGTIIADPAQFDMLEAFERLAADLTAKRSLWQKKTTPKGLYLWGGVGRGKTMIMDLAMTWFQEDLGLACRRFHFHDFMTAVHDRTRSPDLDREQDPASKVASLIAAGAKVLFFDEMEIRDIADAMIIARVMSGFMDAGGVAVMTSNRQPDDLYQGGLHRERFLPFIDLIKNRMVIHEVSSNIDWRQRILDGLDGFVTGDDGLTRPVLDDIFSRLAGGVDPEPGYITVAGRRIDFDHIAASVLAAEFSELCQRSLAARDYLALAERFAGIVLYAIPPMDDTMRNEARRFIWLVDAFYDRGRFLVASSPAVISDLYRGDLWAAEFPRTVSRLTEMTRITGIVPD